MNNNIIIIERQKKSNSNILEVSSFSELMPDIEPKDWEEYSDQLIGCLTGEELIIVYYNTSKNRNGEKKVKGKRVSSLLNDHFGFYFGCEEGSKNFELKTPIVEAFLKNERPDWICDKERLFVYVLSFGGLLFFFFFFFLFFFFFIFFFVFKLFFFIYNKL